jgi:hypothetical protein
MNAHIFAISAKDWVSQLRTTGRIEKCEGPEGFSGGLPKINAVTNSSVGGSSDSSSDRATVHWFQ